MRIKKINAIKEETYSKKGEIRRYIFVGYKDIGYVARFRTEKWARRFVGIIGAILRSSLALKIRFRKLRNHMGFLPLWFWKHIPHRHRFSSLGYCLRCGFKSEISETFALRSKIKLKQLQYQLEDI